MKTKKIYVHYDIILLEANEITASLYLCNDIGNCAAREGQVTESFAISNSAELTDCSKRSDAILSYTAVGVLQRILE